MENMLRLLEEGADPNERVQGFAPLMVAAKASNVPAMELLLLAGADVNAMNPEGDTALSIAVQKSPHVVECLLAHGACLPQEGTVAYGKLLAQIPRCPEKSLEALLRAGLDANARTEDGSTLLMRAAALGRVDMVRVLLAAGADANVVTPRGRTSLSFAMQGQPVGQVAEARMAIMSLLLEAGADPLRTLHGSNEFHSAAWGSRAQALCVLASKCPQGLEVPDELGRTPLMIAAWVADDETLRILLALGANVHARDKEGHGVLSYAARCRVVGEHHPNRLQLLVDKGVSLSADGPRAMMAASQSGTEQAVRWLLAAGMDACATVGDSGNTLLHIATHNEHDGVVEALIEGGAEVNAKNVVGHTPLHFVMTGLNRNRWHVISALLQAGADPYLCNNFDKNPIEWAAPEIREKLLKMLGIETRERSESESEE